MSISPHSFDSASEVHSVGEAANFLKVSKAHLYNLMSRGELPYVKTGKRRLVLKSDLLAYLNVRRIERGVHA